MCRWAHCCAGHSYGGQIMTALGADAPNAAGLVYVAAFGLDQGESIGGLLPAGPVTPALEHMITDKQGHVAMVSHPDAAADLIRQAAAASVAS
jgi:hypothetical protein